MQILTVLKRLFGRRYRVDSIQSPAKRKAEKSNKKSFWYRLKFEHGGTPGLGPLGPGFPSTPGFGTGPIVVKVLMMEQHIENVDTMIEAIEHFSEEQLKAGFAVLIVDAEINQDSFEGQDRELYNSLIRPICEEERQKSEFQSLFSRHIEDMSMSITRAAKDGTLSADNIRNSLGNEKIMTPEKVETGERIWRKLVLKFKETICGSGGPYEALNKDLLGQAALPSTIASTIIAGSLSASTVWLPLVAYVALLLAKTGLKAYCEDEDSQENPSVI